MLVNKPFTPWLISIFCNVDDKRGSKFAVWLSATSNNICKQQVPSECIDRTLTNIYISMVTQRDDSFTRIHAHSRRPSWTVYGWSFFSVAAMCTSWPIHWLSIYTSDLTFWLSSFATGHRWNWPFPRYIDLVTCNPIWPVRLGFHGNTVTHIQVFSYYVKLHIIVEACLRFFSI